MPNNTPGRTPKNFRALFSLWEGRGGDQAAVKETERAPLTAWSLYTFLVMTCHKPSSTFFSGRKHAQHLLMKIFHGT
jgi:hypothetical protein